MSIYGYIRKPFYFLWYCSAIVRVILMLPKEPGPGLENYERIIICKLQKTGSVGENGLSIE